MLMRKDSDLEAEQTLVENEHTKHGELTDNENHHVQLLTNILNK